MATNMQTFNFGIRQSGRGLEPSYGRQHASSIYSGGPGPAEELPHSTSMYSQEPLRNPFQVDQQPRYNPLNREHPRSSSLLNTNDPVAMHLLMETAMMDSKEYEILSFEEVEKLKKESSLLRNRIDALDRKLALENKLRDAAQSLNRLYGSPGSKGDKNGDSSSQSPKRHRRSLLGSRGSNNSFDAQSRADDEFTASTRKIEELTKELNRLEKRQDENHRRILEHTAGILQMTHKGLKKNVRKNELPRSPESMASLAHRSMAHDGVDEFDERSQYQIPDYVVDFGRSSGSTNGYGSQVNTQALQEAEKRLVELSNRLHAIILQTDPEEQVEMPPAPTHGAVSQPGQQINAHLGYMNTGLDAMEAAQARNMQDTQKSIFDSEDRLEDINVRLHDMLEKTNTLGVGPTIMPGESRGKSMQTQLAFSSMVLDRLNQRVEHLMEQRDILGRQIQQQRELNSKSDAQRDAQISDLTEELAETKRLHAQAEEESQKSIDQMNLFMEQLDLAKQESVLLEQQRGVDVDKALQLEKKARKETEENLLSDLRWTQDHNNQIKADFAKMQDEFEIQAQQHLQTTNELMRAKQQGEIELQRVQADLSELQKTHSMQEGEWGELHKAHGIKESELQGTRVELGELQKAHGLRQAEVEKLEGEVVRLQTELTVAKAELDGAYGTRAQRAADVSMNPAIQKEIDDLTAENTSLQTKLNFLRTQHDTTGAGSAELQNKVNNLQKELKDTIEDYELMTKASIEFEKERDHLEASIDNMRERCEGLETQLSDERVRWLGAKSSAPTETTSTMVLKNEFKKMMRDTRAENVKALRAEQEERRRLETLIRSMKKEAQLQTPTKSSLNQSVTADD